MELSLKQQKRKISDATVSDNKKINSRDETFAALTRENTAPCENIAGHDIADSEPGHDINTVAQEIVVENVQIDDVQAAHIKQKRKMSREDKIAHMQAKYAVRNGCGEKCKKECMSSISDDDRHAINASFWSLTFAERRLWFDSHILISPVKTRSCAKVDYSRSYTLQYSLPVSSTKMVVCKTMFLATLGLKTDGMVTEFVKAKTKPEANIQNVIKDDRGKAANPTKIDRNVIEEHILSYNPQISHYKLANNPHKRYLEPHLTIVEMWRNYNSTHKSISYIVYERVFKAMNIGFGKPTQDQCDMCRTLETHREVQEHVRENCDECEKYDRHINSAKAARMAYKADAQHENIAEDTAVFTADMQKVILLPKMTTKEHFFVSRLVVFNETFASMQNDGDYVILWHEGIAGRKASDVASSYIKCINLCGKQHVVIWADNCAGQNKNWCLYWALCWCVNQPWGPSSVTIKYLERGHTYMRADSIHGSIGKRMKKCPEICNFPEFVDVCDKAAAKIKPIAMHHTDFYQFTDETRSRNTKKVTMPKLASICVAKFVKGSRLLQYQESFDGGFTAVDFLKPKCRVDIQIATLVDPRGVSRTKQNKLLKLAESFPPAKRKFWHELPVSDSTSDLLTEFE